MFKIGDRVIIGMKYWRFGIGGLPGTVAATVPALSEADLASFPADFEYKDGMVDVRLDDSPDKEMWFPPKDLVSFQNH